MEDYLKLYTMKNSDIHWRIRQFMKENGITQEDIAKATGLSQPSISGIINGRVKPKKVIAALVDKFGADEAALLGGEGAEITDTSFITKLHGYENATSIVQMKDRDFEPEICFGDYLILHKEDPTAWLPAGRTYLIKTTDGREIVRSVSESDNPDVYNIFIANKPEFSQYLPKQNVRSISIIIGIIKKL